MLDVGGRELARDEPVEPIIVLVFDEPPGGVVLFQPRLEFVLNGSLLFRAASVFSVFFTRDVFPSAL